MNKIAIIAVCSVMVMSGSLLLNRYFYGSDNYDESLSKKIAAVKTITLPHFPAGLAINEEMNLAYVAVPLRPQINIIDLTRHEIIFTRNFNDYFLGNMALSKSGEYLYIVRSYLDEIVVLSPEDLTTLKTISVGDYPVDIKPDATGRYMVVLNYFGNSMSIIDVKSNKRIKDIRVGRKPTCIAALENYVYTVNSGDGTISKVDLATMNTVITFKVHKGKPHGIAVGSGGEYLYISYPLENKVLEVRRESMKVIREIAVGKYPTMIEVANDRNVYVLNAISNSITVYDCLMRKLITEIAVGRCPSIIHYNQRNSMIYVANAADWVNSLVVLKGN